MTLFNRPGEAAHAVLTRIENISFSVIQENQPFDNASALSINCIPLDAAWLENMSSLINLELL